ncbi:TPA: hypothetical protein JG829_002397 [Enterobacter hormaechei subsp. steigerwaltii]|nr:hypothetical protein [Enterobacter hormaechei subsp. steigerwaltii]
MKLIDILVRELPNLGGWPDGVIKMSQDYDGEVWCWRGHDYGTVNSFSRISEIADNHRKQSQDEELSCFVTREQYEAALAASKQEWNGDGLPPVGCRIEYTCKQPDAGHPAIEAGKWYGGTIIAYYGEGVWTSDNGIRHLSNTIFRPLRSEENNKRYAAIEALFEILDAGVSTSQDSIDIYDAIAAGKIPHIRID